MPKIIKTMEFRHVVQDPKRGVLGRIDLMDDGTVVPQPNCTKQLLGLFTDGVYVSHKEPTYFLKDGAKFFDACERAFRSGTFYATTVPTGKHD